MKDKTLDTIFKKTFSSPGTPPEKDEWDVFEAKLNKKMFYKFSWNRFNVYYMSMIFLCLLNSFVFLVVYLVKPTNSTLENSNPAIISDTLISSQTIPEKNETTRKQKQSGISSNRKQTSTTLDSLLSKEKPETKDTIPTSISEETSIPVATSPTIPTVILKRKKTLYISPPPDTIVKVDTVKVKKTKKK